MHPKIETEKAPMDELMQLVERAQKGSGEAFTGLVRRTQARVRAYLGRFVRDKDIADDLAQEAFLKAYRNVSSYRGEAPVTVWLLAIARNQALMYLREERNRRLNEPRPLGTALVEWLADAIDSQAAAAPDHDRELKALETCMSALPGHSADLVAQYYFKRRPLAEIARATGKKSSAVGMTLLRIREILRGCVEDRLSSAGARP